MARPRMVRLPVHVDYEDAADASGWIADVDTAQWFPNGTTYTKVESHPIVGGRLKNCYTVVTPSRGRSGQVNKCILAMSGIKMRGNVIVLRHAKRVPVQVTSVHSSECQFLDAIVARYADHRFIRVHFGSR